MKCPNHINLERSEYLRISISKLPSSVEVKISDFFKRLAVFNRKAFSSPNEPTKDH